MFVVVPSPPAPSHENLVDDLVHSEAVALGSLVWGKYHDVAHLEPRIPVKADPLADQQVIRNGKLTTESPRLMKQQRALYLKRPQQPRRIFTARCPIHRLKLNAYRPITGADCPRCLA